MAHEMSEMQEGKLEKGKIFYKGGRPVFSASMF